MIDRVEDAIATALYKDPDAYRGYYGNAARAAIEAMREPTDVMLEAALTDHDISCALDDCNSHDVPERAWGLMIDAALSEKP